MTLQFAFALAALTSLGHAYDLAPVTDDTRANANAIIGSLLPSSGVTPDNSVAWSRLAYICDSFGPRFSGSAALEAALDWVRDTARNVDGLTVTEQPTLIPKWVRGSESASWTTTSGPPRTKKLHMVGLGMSIGTGGAPITGPGFVVYGRTPADAQATLAANCSYLQGLARPPIILFNVPFTTYGETVGIRGVAGTWAAQCGAIAALIRTVGAYSLQNPHTGYTQNASSKYASRGSAATLPSASNPSDRPAIRSPGRGRVRRGRGADAAHAGPGHGLRRHHLDGLVLLRHVALAQPAHRPRGLGRAGRGRARVGPRRLVGYC
jgi:hypothetical protein